ncbi:single-stranded DNA-binding protein [Bifidobacterium aquikefiricola]|uniref:Single-stranded DNA-binding protein n=1 Tax=Bifidobacterium aquikefiricola TaxID=3059038 RepID=A0AB39U864_9BIFI
MASQQGTITITGFVATEPLQIGREESNPVCTFRLASTRGYFHVKRNQWEERATTWMTVKAYKHLASNVLQSIHKGQPVVVSGVLETEEWTDKHGDHQSAVIIEASCIGHHLGLGVSSFTRKKSPVAASSDHHESADPDAHKVARTATGKIPIPMSDPKADYQPFAPQPSNPPAAATQSLQPA